MSKVKTRLSPTIVDLNDSTKKLDIDVSGASGNTTTTVVASQTDNRTVTLPDASTTLLGTDNTATVTNKTIVVANNTVQTAATGNLTATELNAALGELQQDIDTRSPSNNPVFTGTATVNGDLAVTGTASVTGITTLTTVNATTVNAPTVNAGALGASGNAAITGTLNVTGATTLGSVSATAATAGSLVVDQTTLDNNSIITSGNNDLTINAGGTGELIISDVVRQAVQASTPATPPSGFSKLYPKADGLYLLNSQGTEEKIGSGSGVGINYIDNPSAEVNTAGWGTYNTGTQLPTGAITGSASITWTRSTTTPLRDVAEFLLTKDAANRRGNGVYYDFTIDRADQAKVLDISFDYQIESGTYSGGGSSPTNYSDVIAYIYDVTNARLIEPSAVKLDGGVTGTTYTYQSTFQTDSNSTSYRLLLHVQASSANAFTLKFDNFQVGPQLRVLGAPIVDLGSYTPTTNGLGTISSVDVKSQREGAYLFVHGRFTLGTVSASAAQINLPPGLVAASDYSAVAVVGRLNRGNNSANTVKSYPLIINGGNAFVSVSLDDYASTVSPLSAVNGNTAFSSSEVVTFWFKVKVAGWGSSMSLSQADTQRAVSVRAKGSTTTVGTSATIVINGTVDFDTHSAYNATTGVYTVPVAGRYRVTATVTSATNISASAANSNVLLYARRNSSNYALLGSYSYQISSVSLVPIINGSTLIDCVAGDTIDVTVQRNSNISSFALGGATDNFVTIERLPQNQTIAASETIAARVTLSGNQSISTGSATKVAFDTRTFDTHRAFNTSLNRFVAPAAGVYSVNGNIATTLTHTVGSLLQINIYVNDVLYSAIFEYTTGANEVGVQFSDLVRCNAGDYIEIFASSGDTSYSITSTVLTYLSINRIGSSA